MLRCMSCSPGPLQCSHRRQPRVVPVLQQGRVQAPGVQLRQPRSWRLCRRLWRRGGVRLRLLAGQEQLGHDLGRGGLRQDRQGRGEHVWGGHCCQLSSCLASNLYTSQLIVPSIIRIYIGTMISHFKLHKIEA